MSYNIDDLLTKVTFLYCIHLLYVNRSHQILLFDFNCSIFLFHKIITISLICNLSNNSWCIRLLLYLVLAIFQLNFLMN